MAFTVILQFDGIRRNYQCESYYDAIVLHDALNRVYSHVELWQGSHCLKSPRGLF